MFLLGKIKPDIVFLNIVNKKNMINRLKKRKNKNKYDKFSFNFYNKVQNGFINLSKNQKRYFIINSLRHSNSTSRQFCYESDI